MPKACAFPNCKWTQGGSSQKGWLCAKNGHDTAAFDDWVAALELTSEAQEKVKGLIKMDEKKPEFKFEFNAQWKLLKDVEDGHIVALGLGAASDKKVRHALKRMGNENIKQSSRASRPRAESQRKMVAGETVQTEIELAKLEGKGKRHKRQLVITSSSIHLCEPGKLQKQPLQSVQLRTILQIITSTTSGTDFVLGVEDDFYSNFRFESEEGKRAEVVDSIAAAYRAVTGAFKSQSMPTDTFLIPWFRSITPLQVSR
jgi:hypothetical protein